MQGEKLNADGVSNLEERGEDINHRMLQRHHSQGIIDLVKMSVSSPMKREEVKLPELGGRYSLKRGSNMTVSKTPVQKFDAEKFHHKFIQLGKDISNMELKTKNYARTIGRNGKFCEKAFSNMGNNINSDNKLLNFADVVKKIQVIDKEMLVNDIMDIQKHKKYSINLELIEIDRIKIKKSIEEPIENLIKNSTRIHAIIEDEVLSNIKEDYLEKEKLDNIPIKVF